MSSAEDAHVFADVLELEEDMGGQEEGGVSWRGSP